MLSCEQCRKYLGFYLDQALGVKESLEVQEHLQECQECTDLAAAECSLRAVVRQQAVTAPLPEADKRRLIRVAMQQPRHSWPWLAKLREAIQWRDAGLGAAVTAAVLLVFLSPVRDLLIGHDAARKIVHETALAYHTYLHHDVPMEVETNDDFHLARWANDVVDRNFRVPCITDETAQLVGGRVCRFAGSQGSGNEIPSPGLRPARVRLSRCLSVASEPAHDADRGGGFLRAARCRSTGHLVAARGRHLFTGRRHRPPGAVAGRRHGQVPARQGHGA